MGKLGKVFHWEQPLIRALKINWEGKGVGTAGERMNKIFCGCIVLRGLGRGLQGLSRSRALSQVMQAQCHEGSC